jgi:hypothetical protein
MVPYHPALFAVLALAGVATADDGRGEISQACALAGCFAGDSAGFPVVLTTPGSYALTSTLSVTDASQHGISIQSATEGVFTLDLNGFTIAGPVTCTGQGSTLACGAGAGIGITGPSALVVQNGRVTGFGAGGIAAGARSRIERVIADANGGPGILAGDNSLVLQGLARRNQGPGIELDVASLVEGSAAAENLAHGILLSAGGVVKESSVDRNGQSGIEGLGAAQIEAITAAQNAATGIAAGVGGTVIDSTAHSNGGAGISAADGSALGRNTVRGNTGLGLALSATATYREHTISANSGGSASSGIDMGVNYSALCLTTCWDVGDVVTHVQGDWGDPGLAGVVLAGSFDAVYADSAGVLEVGLPGAAGFSVALTSATAAQVFLPQDGLPGALVADLVDPSTTAAGSFGGEVVALSLNVDFDDAGVTSGSAGVRFGDLRVCGTAIPNVNGLTVRQILDLASLMLGGGSSGVTIASLSPFIEQVNLAFGNGNPSPFAQMHIIDGSCP